MSRMSTGKEKICSLLVILLVEVGPDVSLLVYPHLQVKIVDAPSIITVIRCNLDGKKIELANFINSSCSSFGPINIINKSSITF